MSRGLTPVSYMRVRGPWYLVGVVVTPLLLTAPAARAAPVTVDLSEDHQATSLPIEGTPHPGGAKNGGARCPSERGNFADS